jgi:hypothetical protein
MLDWLKKEIKLEAGKYYEIENDNVRIKPLGSGEFHIECMGNVVRFNMHAMLAQEYVKRFMTTQIDENNPMLLKSDKELKEILKYKELDEDWETCAEIKKILDIRHGKKED